MVSKRETNGKADKPEKPETPRHLAFLHEGNERPNGEHVNDGFHDDLREDFFIFFFWDQHSWGAKRNDAILDSPSLQWIRSDRERA